MASSELACAYAIMILYEEEIPVSAEKISTIVKAANVSVDSYWFGLFAKLAQNKNIGDFIVNSGGVGGAAVAVAAPAAAAGEGGGAAAAPAAEEKKEEPKEESDDDMGFSLFD